MICQRICDAPTKEHGLYQWKYKIAKKPECSRGDAAALSRWELVQSWQLTMQLSQHFLSDAAIKS